MIILLNKKMENMQIKAWKIMENSENNIRNL